MIEPNETLRSEFKTKMRAAFNAGLAYVRSIDPKRIYIGTHFNWPSLSFWENGMPNLSESYGSGPIDYTRAFSPWPDREVPEIPAFKELSDFVIASEFLRSCLLPEQLAMSEEAARDQSQFVEAMIHLIPEELIDRFMHIFPGLDSTEERFNEIFEPVEQSIFSAQLGVGIIVPILLLNFDFDELELDTGVFIRKIEQSIHLARAPIKAFSRDVHHCVLSATTHALVMEGWYIVNRGRWNLTDVMSEVGAFPLDLIDAFFGACRIVTGVATGYAQLLLNPVNWVRQYSADQVPLEGTSVRAYPLWFENYYWLQEELPRVSLEQGRQIASIFSSLQKTKENSLKIAVRRLNSCFLREHDEDIAIDAAIALEALLSDSDSQEMTHKLALRVGALSRLMPTVEKSPSQVFREIKKIYTYRSAIVHGSSSAERKREIVSEGNKKADVVQLAIEYLRAVLGVLIEHEKYRVPRKIDEELLLGVEGR